MKYIKEVPCALHNLSSSCFDTFKNINKNTNLRI